MKNIFLSIAFILTCTVGYGQSEKQIKVKNSHEVSENTGAQKSRVVKQGTSKKHSDGSSNDFTGKYEDGREVFLDKDKMYFIRQGNEFELKFISTDFYQLVYKIKVDNELPKVRFERNENRQVNGLTFVFKDGREDFKKKEL
jgi:hypothetical protein